MAGGDVGRVSKDSESGSVESVDRELCLQLYLDWLEGVSDDHWVLAGSPDPIYCLLSSPTCNWFSGTHTLEVDAGREKLRFFPSA